LSNDGGAMTDRDAYRARLIDDLRVFSVDTLNLATGYLPDTELRWPLFEILRDLAESPRIGELVFARRMHAIRRAAIAWLIRRRTEPGPRGPWSVPAMAAAPDGAALGAADETLRGTLSTVAILAEHGDGELRARAATEVDRLRALLPGTLALLAHTTGGAARHAALGEALTFGLGRIAGALAAGDGAGAKDEAARLEALIVSP
jgi:hypothetical protein